MRFLNRFAPFQIMIILGLSNLLSAQELPVRLYTPQNSSLIQTQVQSVRQAPDGRIWICTFGGLSCFDGLEFTNFNSASGLSSDVVYDVGFTFNNDTVFVLTRDGIDIIVHNRVSSYYYNENQKFYYGKIYYSKRHLLIYGIADRANKGYAFDVKNDQRFLEIPFEFGVGSSSYQGVNDNAAFFFQEKQGKGFSLYQQLFADSKAKLIFTTNQTFQTMLVEDSVIHLIISSSKSFSDLSYFLISLKAKNGNWEQVSSIKRSTIDHNYHNTSLRKPLNDRFFGIGISGHNNLKPVKEQLFVIPNRFAMVNQYVEDRDGNVWLATENGLAKVITSGFREINFPRDNGLNVWSAAPVNDTTVLMATFWDGLFFYSNGNYIKRWKHPRLRGNNCGVAYGTGNDILFASEPGIVIYDTKTGDIRMVDENMPTYTLCLIKDTLKDVYYAGNGSKLISLDSKYQPKVLLDITQIGIKLKTILSIAIQKDGKILLGLATGLVQFNPATGQAEYRIPDKLRFNDLFVDSLNNIWGATNHGLCLIKGKKVLFPAIPGNTGMARTLEEDKRGRVFAAYTNYLLLVDLKQYYSGSADCYMTYGSSNGFSGGEPKQNSFFRDRDGNLWLPTSTNIVKIIPDELNPAMNPIPVKINGFAYADNNLDFILDSTFQKISLPYNRNNIRISFSAVCLTNPESVNYQYKLEGFHKDWIDNNHARFVTLTNLPPGKYCFLVKAGIDKHFNNATAVKLCFIIKSPFWETWWFIMVMVFLAMFLILMGFRLRQQWEQRRRRIQNELLKLKGSALSAQIDQHFLANCNSKIQALYETGRARDANLYSRLFIQFLKVNLQFMRSEEVFLNDELMLVQQYIELERQHSRMFEYEIRVGTDVVINAIQVPHFLIQPVVENAIRHGVKNLEDGEGEILVNVRKHQQYIYICVEDNGPGYYPDNNKNTGGNNVSMNIIRERLELIGHGSSLTIENKSPGTSVTIKLFVHRQNKPHDKSSDH